MATTLYLKNVRSTIAGYFCMSTVANTGNSDTAVVNTAASGTEIQWTKTAGGSTCAWISEPLSAGVTLTSTDIAIYAHESNMSANCGGRYRVFKYTGSESELGGGPFDDGVEFSTSSTLMSWTGNVTDTAFSAGDRIVLKIYITNVGTMASGYNCTLTFNSSASPSALTLAEDVTFTVSISTSDLLAWWDFQDGSGSTVTDKIPSSPTNGSITNATWTTGGPTNLPNGLNFDGAGDYVGVAKDYDFSGQQGCICMWINVNSMPSAGQFDFLVDNSNGGGEFNIFLSGSASNKLMSRSRYTSDRDITSSVAVSTATLYFIAYNFKSGAMELILNTSSVGTNTNTGTLSDSGLNLRFGNLIGGGSFDYDGKIHQAILFNRILSFDEIASLYNGGSGITYDQMFPAPPSTTGSIGGMQLALMGCGQM